MLPPDTGCPLTVELQPEAFKITACTLPLLTLV